MKQFLLPALLAMAAATPDARADPVRGTCRLGGARGVTTPPRKSKKAGPVGPAFNACFGRAAYGVAQIAQAVTV